MNPKPIVIIKYNIENFGSGERNDLYFGINEFFDKQFPDYHTFCYPDNRIDSFDFKVFRTDKFSRIQYKKLTDLIKKSMTQLNKDKK